MRLESRTLPSSSLSFLKEHRPSAFQFARSLPRSALEMCLGCACISLRILETRRPKAESCEARRPEAFLGLASPEVEEGLRRRVGNSAERLGPLSGSARSRSFGQCRTSRGQKQGEGREAKAAK